MIHLSVIMPVRNEADHIADALDRLLAQQYETGKLEILVVDGMSEDTTPQIVQEYAQKHPHIRYLENPKRLSSAARNVAIKHAKGEAVIIADGHCFMDDNEMLRRVDEAFARSGADCLGRPIVTYERKDAPPFQWANAIARESWLGHHPDSFMYSGQAQFSPASSTAIAYRMSVFEKVGLFDENFDAAEDFEFNTRIDEAGLKCWFDPAIAIRYEPRKTLGGLWAQVGRYGRGRVRLWRKHRHTASLKSFAPGLFVFWLCAAALYFPIVWLIFSLDVILNVFPLSIISWGNIAIFFLYAAVIVGESIRLAFKQKRWDILPRLPVVFYFIHFGYGWGVLREFFFPKRVD